MSHPPRDRPTNRARLVREVVPFVLLVCACGAALDDRTGAESLRARANASASASAGLEVPDAAPESFDDLTALGPGVAAGMREAARRSGTGEAVDLVKAEASDACVRVAFAASAPVVASLVDGQGEPLSTLSQPADRGVLGERGPVCIRRGDVVRGVAGGAAVRVRWLAWTAP
jgi:hypothetical protein